MQSEADRNDAGKDREQASGDREEAQADRETSREASAEPDPQR